MRCQSCDTVESGPVIQLWKEYRVGGIESSDRFYLCPDCDREVDPIELWAEEATVTQVKA